MRGKRIAPVDYTAYAPSQPKEETQTHKSHKTHKSPRNVCNRTIPYIIWDATENSPLFSSFSRNGYDPDVSLRWLRGRNEFDRQLASARHHARVLQHRSEAEKLRQKLLHNPNAEAVFSASLLAEQTAGDIGRRASACPRSDSIFVHTDTRRHISTRSGDEHRPFSSSIFMPYIKSNGKTGSIRPRSATTTTIMASTRRTLDSSNGSRVCDSTCSVKSATARTTATAPLACMRHSCLVVQDSAKLPATMGFVSEVCVKSKDNNNSNNKNPNEKEKKEEEKKKKDSSSSSSRENKINIIEPVWPRGKTENAHLSRFYDERLMRVLRESTAVC